MATTTPDSHLKNGLGLGMILGVLGGLLVGVVVLLTFELSRRDALLEVEQRLAETNEKVTTPERVGTAIDADGMDESTTTTPSTPTTPPTPGAPTISKTTPANGAKNVAKNLDKILITFSAPMQGEFFDSNSIGIYRNGIRISNRFSYDYKASSNTVQVTLSSGQILEPGSQIEVRVSGEVKSATGMSLGDTQTFSFTLAS
ncbi:MAG: Ig-like domain-containing protein [Candidatus Andersenbacteria bacterium]